MGQHPPRRERFHFEVGESKRLRERWREEPHLPPDISLSLAYLLPTSLSKSKLGLLSSHFSRFNSSWGYGFCTNFPFEAMGGRAVTSDDEGVDRQSMRLALFSVSSRNFDRCLRFSTILQMRSRRKTREKFRTWTPSTKQTRKKVRAYHMHWRLMSCFFLPCSKGFVFFFFFKPWVYLFLFWMLFYELIWIVEMGPFLFLVLFDAWFLFICYCSCAAFRICSS